MAYLQTIRFTGNIRELHNVVERLVILGGNTISVADIQNNIAGKNADSAFQDTENQTWDFDGFNHFQDFKDYMESEFIKNKLIKNNWNVSKTADELAMQRSHLYAKIEKYALKR